MISIPPFNPPCTVQISALLLCYLLLKFWKKSMKQSKIFSCPWLSTVRKLLSKCKYSEMCFCEMFLCIHKLPNMKILFQLRNNSQRNFRYCSPIYWCGLVAYPHARCETTHPTRTDKNALNTMLGHIEDHYPYSHLPNKRGI